MRIATISRGGQISIPADIRHRWGTTRLLLVDSGDSIVLRPIPDDPIAAAIGSLKSDGPTAEEAIAQLREEEDYVYRRRGWS